MRKTRVKDLRAMFLKYYPHRAESKTEWRRFKRDWKRSVRYPICHR